MKCFIGDVGNVDNMK